MSRDSGAVSSVDDAPLLDVIVADVGSAGPRVAAVIAGGLGLPVEAVIGTIYRAPAVIAAGLATPVAERLVAEFAALGLSVHAAPAGTPIERGPLLDVAAEIVDPALAEAAAAALGDFLGITPPAALELLLTPPGLVLGQASAATVDALAARLPPGAVALSTAEPATASYTLFAAALPAAEHAAIAAMVPAIVADGDGGLVATGLTRADADRLWRRLAQHDGVRLVPEAFLRFDLHLVDAEEGDAAALERLAGIPAADVSHLIDLLPVTIEERLTRSRAEERLAAYAAAGFVVTAHLATFATTTLEIAAAPPAALALVGSPTTALPLRLPPLAVARARVLRARLEAAGADVAEVAA